MVLPLRLTLKRSQLCDVQTATRLAVQRNKVSLRLCRGHKYLKNDRRTRKARVVGWERFPMKSGVADCFLVVVVLHRISHEVIY
ncbi:hypothetical protein BDR03DRAFT_643150 [Suillus americanus]|nr:hypothetical protein BDR03DRAFT_643150 [Suillus americanus]